MPIKEFIGLRSKMHSYVKDNGKNEKTAKGVRKYLIKKHITHENYKDYLLKGKKYYIVCAQSGVTIIKLEAIA